MSITLNEAVLSDFLRSTTGPVGRDLAARVHNVQELAAANATGPIIDVRTADLVGSIRGRVEAGAEGLVGIVSSNASHRGFLYPAWVHREGEEPAGWIKQALRNGFERII